MASSRVTPDLPETVQKELDDLRARLASARRLIAQLNTLMDELCNAAARHKAHWEEERGKAMLEVAFELHDLLKPYQGERKPEVFGPRPEPPTT